MNLVPLWESNIRAGEVKENVFLDTDEERVPAVDLMFSHSHMTQNRSDYVIMLLSHYPVVKNAFTLKNALQKRCKINCDYNDFSD